MFTMMKLVRSSHRPPSALCSLNPPHFCHFLPSAIRKSGSGVKVDSSEGGKTMKELENIVAFDVEYQTYVEHGTI